MASHIKFSTVIIDNIGLGTTLYRYYRTKTPRRNSPTTNQTPARVCQTPWSGKLAQGNGASEQGPKNDSK